MGDAAQLFHNARKADYKHKKIDEIYFIESNLSAASMPYVLKKLRN